MRLAGAAPRCLCASAVILWLWLARSVVQRFVLARTPGCLPLPPHWRDGSSRDRNATATEPSFVLLWSTATTTFTLRTRRCLESIFFHHPRATVSVYSNELPDGFFADLRRLQYDVRVLRYNVTQLLSGTPAAPWLARLDEWRRGPYFYSHVTDAVRLALLFRVGGVYLDTDVLLARPLRLAPAFSAASVPPWPAGKAPATAGHGTDDDASRAPSPLSPPPLRDALGVESYADPRTGLPVLNGAVMAFERGSRFLWNCLHEFERTYIPDRWSWNGPELLTRVQLRCAASEGASVQIEPPERFYPLHWSEVAHYADGLHPSSDAALWDTISSQSYTVHVWNRKTADLTFARGSLLHKLHNSWMVLPEREACT